MYIWRMYYLQDIVNNNMNSGECITVSTRYCEQSNEFCLVYNDCYLKYQVMKGKFEQILNAKQK
jgi:hypothetical protein